MGIKRTLHEGFFGNGEKPGVDRTNVLGISDGVKRKLNECPWGLTREEAGMAVNFLGKGIFKKYEVYGNIGVYLGDRTFLSDGFSYSIKNGWDVAVRPFEALPRSFNLTGLDVTPDTKLPELVGACLSAMDGATDEMGYSLAYVPSFDELLNAFDYVCDYMDTRGYWDSDRHMDYEDWGGFPHSAIYICSDLCGLMDRSIDDCPPISISDMTVEDACNYGQTEDPFIWGCVIPMFAEY